MALFVGAVGGGVGAWWASGSVEESAPVAKKVTSEAKKPPMVPGVVPSPGPAAEAAAKPLPAAAEEVEGEGIRAGAQPGDDPAMRAALEKQAELAMPYWARIAPRFADPQDRLEAAAMVERLGRLNEPATIVAHDQYRLTQRLISEGGLDRGSQTALDYLNSTAAAVLQGGNPAEVITPEQATARKPR
ncbi:hypothetical protein LBMAG42_42520 [Deltaproteobacteria bacterium]|nr:hypothetical protein LBMAG42_42520 [Deltaproteobacteria bacterium]